MTRRHERALTRYDTTPDDTDRERARAELAAYDTPAHRAYYTAAVLGLRAARTPYADTAAAAREVARARALFDAYLDDATGSDGPGGRR